MEIRSAELFAQDANALSTSTAEQTQFAAPPPGMLMVINEIDWKASVIDASNNANVGALRVGMALGIGPLNTVGGLPAPTEALFTVDVSRYNNDNQPLVSGAFGHIDGLLDYRSCSFAVLLDSTNGLGFVTSWPGRTINYRELPLFARPITGIGLSNYLVLNRGNNGAVHVICTVAYQLVQLSRAEQAALGTDNRSFFKLPRIPEAGIASISVS